ncbi:MAG: serine/threonine-protein kinase [Polyangia bacterium]|jgi:hypothetical protein|nr:serine/threonine-protein kinase [Polyangia bacterium]
MSEGQHGAYRVGDRFVLGEAMERRGIGDLYSGTDDLSGAPVQILLVSPYLFAERWQWERAHSEIGRICQTNHPNIVRVFCVGAVEDGRLFVVSEPPPGPTLAGFVGSRGPIPLERAVPLFEGLVAALEEGRRLGVWHRDLSPSNLYLNEDLGTVKLHNFGLAEPAGGAARGDPWFMAPEQTTGAEPDEQRLVYGLGALWYYLACGQPVFMTDDPARAIQRLLTEVPVPPSQRRPDLGIPEALDSFLMGALSKSPSGRQAGLAAFLSGARALLVRSPVGDTLVDRVAAPAALAAPAAMTSPPAAAEAGAPAPRPTAQFAQALHPALARQQAQAPAARAAAPANRAVDPQAREAQDGRRVAAASRPRRGSPTDSSARSGRRKRSFFRETLWFKKGESSEDDEAGAQDLGEVRAGDGMIADAERNLDERYRDDGSVSPEDRRKYSVKTGYTGQMTPVRLPKPMDPGAMPDPERRRALWAWLIIAFLLLCGGGAAAAFFLLGQPKSFVPSHLGATLAGQVSEYKEAKPRKVLVPPSLRAMPEGKEAELFAKLRETAYKAELLLPQGSTGAVDVLAALEQRRIAIDKENAPLPAHRRTSLWKRIHRRNYRAVEREYGQLKGKVVEGVKALLESALKGQGEQALLDAKAACLQLLDSGGMDSERAALESSCKALDVHFGLEEKKAGQGPESPPGERSPAPERSR